MKLNRKTLKIGSFTLISTAIVLAVLIFVNLFAAELPQKFTYFDTTPGKVYTLSEDSLSFLEGITTPVEIYMITENGQESSQTIQITAFIEKYVEANSNITFKTVDPILHPDFASRYTDETVSQNSVIVVGNRTRIIDGGAWYMYETDYGSFDASTYEMYYSYGYVDGTDPFLFYGEMNLTGAIDYVTSADIPKAYILTGHGETQISETFTTYIANENIEYEALSLLSGDGSIPEDADILIINTPQNDFREEECNAIVDYYKNGGNVILTTNFQYFSKELTPNLASALETMGLSTVDGVVVEGDAKNYYQYATWIVPESASSCPFSLNSLNGKMVFTPYSHGIKAAEGTAHTVYEIFQTSDKAYLKTDAQNSETLEKEEGDIDGQYVIAAIASPSGSDNTSGILWIASPTFLDGQYDLGNGNGAFFAETIKWMADKETTISILGVNMNSDMLMVTEQAIIGWGFCLVIALPVVILGAGLFIWIRRRKR